MENQENQQIQKDETVKDTKTPKYTKEELAIIFDDILFQGYYQEDFMIKNRLQVTFRSRSAEDTSTISRKLDGASYNLGTTYIEQRALWNLASSVMSISGKDYSKLTLEQRFAEIGKLNSGLVSLLSTKLVDFDLKIDAANKEGEENF